MLLIEIVRVNVSMLVLRIKYFSFDGTGAAGPKGNSRMKWGNGMILFFTEVILTDNVDSCPPAGVGNHPVCRYFAARFAAC